MAAIDRYTDYIEALRKCLAMALASLPIDSPARPWLTGHRSVQTFIDAIDRRVKEDCGAMDAADGLNDACLADETEEPEVWEARAKYAKARGL